MRKSKFRKIAAGITFLLFLLSLVVLITPSNSFLFEQPIKNQEELGNEILAVFKSRYISSDTIFLANKRTYNIDCGTGIKANYLDNIKNKYYKITHRNVIDNDNLFTKPLVEAYKIVLTEIVNYSNEKYPSNSNFIDVKGNAINGLELKKKKIFILKFDSINSDKVEVVFIDYLRKSVALHLTFVLENNKWKLSSTNY